MSKKNLVKVPGPDHRKKHSDPKKLRKTINRSGLSIYKLADETGISRSGINQFLSGDRGWTYASQYLIETVCYLAENEDE